MGISPIIKVQKHHPITHRETDSWKGTLTFTSHNLIFISSQMMDSVKYKCQTIINCFIFTMLFKKANLLRDSR